VLLTISSICAGASAGALLRWMLGKLLNPLWVSVPLGTLAANLLGGYLIGVAFAFFSAHPSPSPELRLLIVTGFLGALTTFSTFSVEVVTAAQRGDLPAAFATIALHLVGSLACTVLGIATVALARAS